MMIKSFIIMSIFNLTLETFFRQIQTTFLNYQEPQRAP